ncbi:MAG: EAL domain-containing protein [Rhodocyclales bacterium]|nr:EAL domain-containing protein [Rhodocyclales bacterium]
MILQDRIQLFSRRFWPTVVMFFALAAAFGAYVHSEKQIDRANERRQIAILLADQLRQSSDDLTRMARTYVATGDPRYKKYYQDILDIRDGRKPRPPGYNYIYWDLVLSDAEAQPAGGGQAAPLLELIREAGSPEDELRKLAEAKVNSDGLTAIEFEAMKLVETTGADTATARARALQMMHDAGYHRAKGAIMRPINEAYALMDQRTADQIGAADCNAGIARSVFIACVLGALFLLWREYGAMRATLGGSAEEVHQHILRIGRGDFTSVIDVAPGMEESVIAGLSAMQVKLQSNETQGKQAEAELRASADGLNEAQRIAQVGSWTLDLVSGELIWSDEVFRLFEIDPKQFAATYEAFLDAIHPDDRDEVNQAYANSLATRAPYEITHRLRMRDGRIKWVHEQCLSNFDSAGKPLRSQGTVQDVTQRKLAELAMRQSEQKFSTAFSSCPVAASIAAAEDGRFIEANPNYERDFGWTTADLIGRTSVEVGIWPDAAARQSWVEALRRESRLVDYESIWMHKNGERRNVSFSAEIIELDGKPRILAYAIDITARKRTEQALMASETRLRAVLDGVHTGVITITEQGIVESFNRSAERLFGYSAVEVVGNNVKMLMPVPYKTEHDGYLDNYRRSGIGKVIGRRTDVVAQRKDGSIFHIELGVTETLLNDRKLFVGSVGDISFRKEAEAELRIAATAFESQEGMVVTDPDGVILRVNRAFTVSTGYPAAEVIGQTPRLLRSGRHDAAFYAAMWGSLKSTGAWQGEIWDRRKNGEIYPKWLSISSVKREDGVVTHFVGMHQDITERKIAEERIKELAFFDSLTHLPNRTLLLDRLQQAMTASSRNGSYGSLLFIDLDNFKTLNDTLGHDMGDLLLRQVAQRLAGSVREGDTVARLGGDEFVVVLGSLSANIEEAATQTEAVGGKILAALNGMYQLNGIEYRSTASIGATLFRGHEASIDDLMKQADLAMYKSKARGRNALHFFDPDMETAVMERASLEAGLREAVQQKQFVLHYQAQVVDGARVTGAEVLVRWRHPLRGLVSPAEFIPLAEETGLILPLGNWVLETACTRLARWSTRPAMSHLTVAVNVSAQQFHESDFVDQVLAIVRQTGANPNRLKLELTESLLVDNVEDVIEKMFALKAEGVGFSLDDFGTGYSSLSYLKRLPLDQLKIDQSFVRDILVDPNDAAIARTIVALAQSLGLGVIAEGVETETQRAFLASSGCHVYQGYYFSRPLPVEAFEEFAMRA